uniref:BRCA1/BRCA2-containing complex subunit 3 n=1 Tax=Scleropages formosus TaxID=113540 RepID=A0A8C9QXL6_SCLFO
FRSKSGTINKNNLLQRQYRVFPRSDMAVSAVHLESDAFLVCMNHALSTEKEEVMGLCIGEVDTNRIVHIHSVIILRRSDKRKDRVEISPEQLSAASTEADISSPAYVHKIVDVRTQAMYQMMDQGFVGLIFSCFIEDKNTKTGRVLYTCFQSVQAQKGSEYERIEIPIHVVPHEAIGKVCLESAVELPRILCQEEQDTYRRIHSLTHLDPITKIHNGSGIIHFIVLIVVIFNNTDCYILNTVYLFM